MPYYAMVLKHQKNRISYKNNDFCRNAKIQTESHSKQLKQLLPKPLIHQ